MQVTELEIPDVKLIVPKRFEDRRGFFSEIYNARLLADAGITDTFVQDNLSLSTEVGTIRGLHFQTPPYAQAKLVRVSRGRILDVAVDLRRSSPTLRQTRFCRNFRRQPRSNLRAYWFCAWILHARARYGSGL